MRYLFVLVAALVVGCGDDTTPSVPMDMAVLSHDCAHIVFCSCQDGTCQHVSGCGPGVCDNLCIDHGGPGGMACVGDALF